MLSTELLEVSAALGGEVLAEGVRRIELVPAPGPYDDEEEDEGEGVESDALRCRAAILSEREEVPAGILGG